MILIIDDDERFIEITQRRLRPHGLSVCGALSWVDALPLFRLAIDLVLLDIRMLSLSGDRLCTIIKQRYPRIPVVLYSSEPESVIRNLADASGADGYLSKSANGSELAGLVMNLLVGRTEPGAAAGGGDPRG